MRKTVNKFRRRAQIEEMPRIVIAVVALVIIVIIVGIVNSAVSSKIEKSQCEIEVEKHERLLDLGHVDALVTDIYCPTRMKTLNASKDKDINKEVANEAYYCWKEWKRGSAKLFKEDEGIFCHVCSVFDFKNKDRLVPGYQQFISSNKVPDKSMTYQKYFQVYFSNEDMDVTGQDSSEAIKMLEKEDIPIASEQEFNAIFNEKMQSIDTSQTYAAVFLYAKGQDEIEQVVDFFRQVGNDKEAFIIAGGALVLKLATVKGLVALGTSKLVAGAVGATLVPTPVAIVAGTVLVGLIIYEAYKASQAGVEWMATPLLVKWDSDTLERLDCGISPAKQTTGQVE